MNIGLSIYSAKGFREVTLPERESEPIRVLLQKELFGLKDDISIDLRQISSQQGDKGKNCWSLRIPGGMIQQRKPEVKPPCQELTLTPEQDGAVFQIKSGGVTVISFAQPNPFPVYRKYRLSGEQKITVGLGDHTICYNYSYVSESHCTLTIHNGKATLTDEKSTNGTFVNFRRIEGSVRLRYGDSIRVMRLHIVYLGNVLAINECEGLHINSDLISIPENRVNDLARSGFSGGGQHILFRRSPRDMRKLHTEPFKIEAPPNPQETPQLSVLAQIGPSLTMTLPMILGTTLSAYASRLNGASSGTMMYMGMITSLTSACLATMWAIVNLRRTGKQRRQAENRRFESYRDYLLRIRKQIGKAYDENTAALQERYPDGKSCCAMNERSPLLWNRNVFHDDFLNVRLGRGDIPFQSPITIPEERFTLINDTLADKPRVIQENFQMLRDVPFTVDLLQHRLIGIAGGENRRAAIAIARAMIAQIAAGNCYTDVKIAIIYDGANDEDRGAWDFAMWLPHVWSSDKKIRYIATTAEERDETFYALTQALRRNQQRENNSGKIRPRFVLFVSSPSLLDGQSLNSRIFERESDTGLSTVLLAARHEQLPNECEYIIENDSRFQGFYDTCEGIDCGSKLLFDAVPQETMEKFARTLSRIEVMESEQDGEIPDSLTFFDMFAVQRPEELNAPERWKTSDVVKSMKALVGFRSGNMPCYLDIHEQFHGPHGLVAGTTGSGKSETLQTYILSLAVNFSPEDVGFFIIDYKGGGMANLFDNLPHMIGSISNLSGNQVQRAMVSIQSENRRRQRIFTEHGVNNINGYTRLYKKHEAREPIPHLFIIIDEFAELKREQADFMKELISVAQVGRSLGVHLILSTQRPNGTVDENIWANSKFRLCLRVQDRQDSIDMLHRDDAAFLTRAGRCYMQVGNDEIFDLFQSGYSGASYDKELGGSNQTVAQMLNPTGKMETGSIIKNRRGEQRQRKWVGALLRAVRTAEEKTAIHTDDPSFSFRDSRTFQQTFYEAVQKEYPDFEQSVANDARMTDFCELCRAFSAETNPDVLTEQIIHRSKSTGKRLPELRIPTQLEAVIDYLGQTAQKLGLHKIPKLWLPVLPEKLYLEDLEEYRNNAFDGTKWPEKPNRFQLCAVIGEADDPANQAKHTVSIDFALGGNHMLLALVGTGKSTFLQTVIYSLASRYSPDILNLYCLDFSSKMLSVFANLKHTGGYMDENDLESDRISKFFTLISKILDERKARFAGTNFGDAVNHNGWSVPAIVIAIDNYGGFREKVRDKAGDDIYDALITRLAKEGNGYGIYLLVSAGGVDMNELPTRLAGNFRTGVALEMKDPYAYTDVLHEIRPPVLPESGVRGRGLIRYEGRILEFQTALAAPGRETYMAGSEDENSVAGDETFDRNELIAAQVLKMNAAWNGPGARTIPSIPEKPTRDVFCALSEYEQAKQNPLLLPVGYDFEFADIYSLNLVWSNVYLVTGYRQSGKSVFMENLMLTCAERQEEVLIADITWTPAPDEKDLMKQRAYTGGERFHDVAERINATQYTDAEGLGKMLTYLNTEMNQRASVKLDCISKKMSDEEMIKGSLVNRRINVFIGNLRTFILEMHDTGSPAHNGEETFNILCQRGKGYNIFIFGEIDDDDHVGLKGYTSLNAMCSFQAGIRFGGHCNTDKLLAFKNMNYNETERSEKPGIGVIPGEKGDRVVKVVVPMC